MKTHGIFIFCIFTIFFASVFVSACRTSDAVLPYGKSPEPSNATVMTEHGAVRGIYSSDGSVELFAGLPYAKPPVGDLRWKEPLEMDGWNGVYEAYRFKPLAMQKQNPKIVTRLFNAYIHSPGDRTDFAPVSEDCLYLNIWRPSDASGDEKLPVLVYVHGGSLTTGSSWFESYDGEALAKQGIIMVTVSYRLGIFGYFASEELAAESPNGTTGNYGLLDQIKALDWVHRNIGSFGGDAENITIAGESAGSSSINAICASELSRGTFRRAIAESSSLVVPVPAHTFRSRESAIELGKKAMKEFNASSIEELRKVKAEKLVRTRHLFNSMTVDGHALCEYPWETYLKNKNHEEALLNGFNSDEGRAFTTLSKINRKNYAALVKKSPYVTSVEGILALKDVKTDEEAKRLYTDMFAAVCFTYPHYSWTKILSAQKKPVWEYCFSKENRGISNMHSGEMVYAYGNLFRNSIYDEDDHRLSRAMQGYWLNFVKYGDPNGKPGSSEYAKDFPYWERADENGEYDGSLLILDTQIKMGKDPFIPFYSHLDFNIDRERRPATFGSREEQN